MTAPDLISSALLEIGCIDPGETPPNSDVQRSFTVLQQMIDALGGRRAMYYAVQRQLFVPTTLKQTYTLGVGGDFNVARPAIIARYGVINISNAVQPLELPLLSVTPAQWEAIPVKNIASALPQKVWDDGAFPFRNLSYWPVPNVTVNFTIYNPVMLSTWPDLITDLVFPPAYMEMFRYELARRLAPSFGAAAMWSPLLESMRRSAYDTVQAMNFGPMDLRCDPAIVDSNPAIYNWLTDGQPGPGGN